MQCFTINRGFPVPAAAGMMRSAFPSRGWLWFPALVAGLLAAMPEKSGGQEALRQSLAGSAAAEAQSQAAATIGYYNLQLGDASLRFSTSLGVQYNDNIHLQNSDPQGDEIVTPGLNTQIHYPVTQNNSLDVSVGAGYSMYLNTPDMDRFFITPGTGLFYNIFVGDFVINLHERVSVSENGYANPAANGRGNNATLENTAGLSVTWDLNQVVLVAGYDHGNYLQLGSVPSWPDSATENIYLNAGVRVAPEFMAGLEAGGSTASYSQSGGTTLPNAEQLSAGAFGRLQISEYLSAQLHAGWSELVPQGGSTNLNTVNIGSGGGLYFNLSLSHRVNRWLDYTLSAGRSQDLQAYGQPYTRYTVQWSPNWKLFRKYSVSTPVWWTRGTQYYSRANTYEQFGAGLNVGRQITEKLTGSLSYQFIRETSGETDLNYVVNIISLNFSQRF